MQGRVDLPSVHRTGNAGRPTQEPELENLSAVGAVVTGTHLTDALLHTVDTAEGLYGRRKMTAHLRRSGHQVATCTLD